MQTCHSFTFRIEKVANDEIAKVIQEMVNSSRCSKSNVVRVNILRQEKKRQLRNPDTPRQQFMAFDLQFVRNFFVTTRVKTNVAHFRVVKRSVNLLPPAVFSSSKGNEF